MRNLRNIDELLSTRGWVIGPACAVPFLASRCLPHECPSVTWQIIRDCPLTAQGPQAHSSVLAKFICLETETNQRISTLEGRASSEGELGLQPRSSPGCDRVLWLSPEVTPMLKPHGQQGSLPNSSASILRLAFSSARHSGQPWVGSTVPPFISFKAPEISAAKAISAADGILVATVLEAEGLGEPFTVRSLRKWSGFLRGSHRSHILSPVSQDKKVPHKGLSGVY